MYFHFKPGSDEIIASSSEAAADVDVVQVIKQPIMKQQILVVVVVVTVIYQRQLNTSRPLGRLCQQLLAQPLQRSII